MNWKKDFKTSALIILLVITAIALMDNARTADSAAKLEEDKNRLETKVTSLEKEIERRSRMTDDLKNENDTLAVNLSNLEEEVAASQSSVRYQDFMDAISVVETYKAAGEFKEVIDLIALGNFTSFGTLDQDDNCPCTINFKYSNLEWIPGVVLDLSGFKIEKGRIVLTYLTVEDLEDNYQFVLTKSDGFYDRTEKWRIEEIRLVEKEGSPL
ncbi:hypothetical protein [Mesobacillus selenatarsenatis]|uniref:Uncharacterized protein n=1 Tax=Mesobacillus selenatarsenatis TaxID=388741 RepID=A0A846TG16_9BACI|nr:hypothetical protein [Mesobacillus selenatarsenatis]NKE05860.1 hypothetical protein [Mesobacillus selenatarsenatis]